MSKTKPQAQPTPPTPPQEDDRLVMQAITPPPPPTEIVFNIPSPEDPSIPLALLTFKADGTIECYGKTLEQTDTEFTEALKLFVYTFLASHGLNPKLPSASNKLTVEFDDEKEIATIGTKKFSYTFLKDIEQDYVSIYDKQDFIIKEILLDQDYPEERLKEAEEAWVEHNLTHHGNHNNDL